MLQDGDREYALAWSHITHYRFWSLWKDYLEKAAASLDRLTTEETAQ